MPGIEVTANNPLGLTIAGPGYSTSYNYPGQTGSVTSGAGYTFPTFANQQSGIAAGIDYIQRKINSGTATTAQGLVNLFSPNDWNAFQQTTGLSANSPLDPSQAGLYAAGIASGEGTLNEFGGTSAFTGGQSGGDLLSNATSIIGAMFNVGSSSMGLDATGSNAKMQTSVSGQGVSDFLNKAFSAANVTGWLGRGAIVVLGVFFVIIALFILAKGPQIVAKAAVVAA